MYNNIFKQLFQYFSLFYTVYFVIFRFMLYKKEAITLEIEFIRERITQLRIQKGVSEYKMSYDLGHSRGYINNISSGKTLPSMTEFLAICEYFDISPEEFFNTKSSNPKLSQEITSALEQLNEADQKLTLLNIKRLLQK